ncbi:MAG TPA: MFS transporter [Novosphingobium sp.]|nr:MFS transporter [Novosphingobium sp.]
MPDRPLPDTAPEEAPPPLVWLMGLVNMSFGLASAVFIVTLPQLLAEAHVPEPAIANLTAVGLVSGVVALFLAPVLDVGLSRRTYTIALAGLTAAMAFVTLGALSRLDLLGPLVLALSVSSTLFGSALAGWLGASLPKSADKTLSAWFNIGNGSGFGVGALLHYQLLGLLPGLWGRLAVAGLILLPLVLLPALPGPTAERQAFRESFGRLAGDLGALLRQKLVLRLLMLFALPCASFALTNLFGGIGGAYHASPVLVDGANGFGVVVISVLGSLIARPLLDLVPPALLYLLTGSIGACCTLALLALPHTPATYVLAVVVENLFQSAAFVIQYALQFRSIARGSPLAVTQFALMGAAANLPLAYMQSLDGRGFGQHGVAGAYLVDAGISLAACAAIAPLVWRWWRRGHLGEAAATLPCG